MKISTYLHRVCEDLKAASFSSICLRIALGYIRYHYFRFFNKYHLYSGQVKAIPNTLEYNLKAISKFPLSDFLMPRMKWLVDAAYAIPDINKNAKVLVIGPRSENDIMLLKSKGAKYVCAIDLISYSPYVTIADMHSIPFNDNTFDLVLVGWTLPYSSEPEAVIKEIKRVAKQVSFLCIGLEYINNYKPFINPIVGPASQIDDISFEGINRLNESSDIESLLSSVFTTIRRVFCYNHLNSDVNIEQLSNSTGLASSQVMTIHQCIK